MCKSAIDKQAWYCKECDHYQNPIINGLMVLSKTAIVLSLLVSASFWIVTQWPSVKNYLWKDVKIKILALNTYGDANILNTGNRSVYLSYVVMQYGPNNQLFSLKEIPINSTLEPGESFLREITAKDINGKDNVFFTSKQIFHKKTTTLEDWEDIKRRFHSHDKCLVMVFYSQEDPYWKMTDDMAKTWTVDVNGIIYFYDFEKEKYASTNFPSSGTIVEIDNCKSEALSTIASFLSQCRLPKEDSSS